ncbi:MAG: MerR family transcriptional regulator [Clostridiales Family XIII bacterium]|jgi:DNA-binding transcriptional MerR regulator|nr:MerR family transcriptional regulator [Clostridiales Family XIII bacterium]
MIVLDNEEYYSVGEAAKLCNISRKALRFYDEIGIISPDRIGENEYRYYKRDTLLMVPVIKYYKQMGFKLEEMRDFIAGATYVELEESFKTKKVTLKKELSRIEEQYTSVRDWYNLIVEASVVIESNATDVGVKYFEPSLLCYQDQPYKSDYKDAIINIEFTNYIESLENEITGPVIRYFGDVREKLAGKLEMNRILQKTILDCPFGRTVTFGGKVMLSCYHIGSHYRLSETYDKMFDWAGLHGYKCKDAAYERYVTDYWTTSDAEKHVTEVIIEISR